MKKNLMTPYLKLPLTLLFCTLLFPTFAQDSLSNEDLSRLRMLFKAQQERELAIAKLSAGYAALEKSNAQMKQANQEMRQKITAIKFADFKTRERMVKDAFDKTDVISTSTTYQQVIKSSIRLHNKITQVNNFTDAREVFGIDFVEQITDIARATLVDKLEKMSPNEPEAVTQQRKSRLSGLITAILKNPIIEGLVKSNPITSVAHSIINQTMAASATKLTDIRLTRSKYQLPEDFKSFKSEYGEFKKSFESIDLAGGLPETRQLVAEEAIQEFTEQLQPFIKLFDELSRINKEYESSLEVFLTASEQTISRAKPVERAFYSKLGVANRQEARSKIDAFFNVGPNPSMEVLEQKLADRTMKEVAQYADEVNEVHILLKNDFLKILALEIALSEEYAAFFESLKEEGEELPKFRSTQQIKERIEEFETLGSILKKQKEKLER